MDEIEENEYKKIQNKKKKHTNIYHHILSYLARELSALVLIGTSAAGLGRLTS